MAAYPIVEVPLSGLPERFTITLAGRTLGFRLTYANVFEAGWLLDISDGNTGDPIISGIPLVTGTDLLGQYQYLGLNFALFVATDSDPDAVPVFGTLGTTSHLYAVPFQ